MVSVHFAIAAWQILRKRGHDLDRFRRVENLCADGAGVVSITLGKGNLSRQGAVLPETARPARMSIAQWQAIG